MLVSRNSEKVQKYAPKIINNWENLATKVKEPRHDELNTTSSFIIDRKNFEEELLRKELQKIRAEFIAQAQRVEAERQAELKSNFQNELDRKVQELDRAYRIINIQTAILSRLYENNKELILKVFHEADISEDDLAILSGTKVD